MAEYVRRVSDKNGRIRFITSSFLLKVTNEETYQDLI